MEALMMIKLIWTEPPDGEDSNKKNGMTWLQDTTSRLFIGALYWDGIDCGAESDWIEEHLRNTPRFLLSKCNILNQFPA